MRLFPDCTQHTHHVAAQNLANVFIAVAMGDQPAQKVFGADWRWHNGIEWACR